MSQYTIIGGDGKEYGPVSAAEVQEWVQAGRANGETRIRVGDAADWVALRDVPALAPALTPATPAPHAGTPPFPATSTGTMPMQDPPLPPDLFARDHGVWSAGCFERGWAVFSNHMGGSIGVVVLFMVIMAGITLFSLIPLIGLVFSLAAMILQPVLTGGMLYYFIKANRNQNPQVGDLFSGFERNFGGLFLVSLIQSLIILATMIPGFILMAISVGGPVLEAIRTQSEPDFGGANLLLFFGAIPLMLLPAMYLGVCWAFALPLAIDRRLSFWDAMEASRKVVHKHWFQLFFFFIVFGMIAQVGVLACGVGLIFTIPLALAIQMAAYEHLFGDRTGAAQGQPTAHPPVHPQPLA